MLINHYFTKQKKIVYKKCNQSKMHEARKESLHYLIYYSKFIFDLAELIPINPKSNGTSGLRDRRRQSEG